MESVKRAKLRLQKYPSLIARCSSNASAYAACVTRNLNVTKDVCANEFNEFKKCLIAAAKK